MGKKKESKSHGVLIDAILAVFWFPFKTVWKWITKLLKWFGTLPFKNFKLFLIIVAVICVVIWIITG